MANGLVTKNDFLKKEAQSYRAGTVAKSPAASSGLVTKNDFLKKEMQAINSGGTSQRDIFDTETDFKKWRDSIGKFQTRVTNEYSSRGNGYQAKSEVGRDTASLTSEATYLKGQADRYRNYFTNNKDLYGEEQVSQILKDLDEATKYLDSVRDTADSDHDYWSQWDTEADYNEHVRLSNLNLRATEKDVALWTTELKMAEKKISAAQDKVNSYNNLNMTKEMQEAQAELEAAYAEQRRLKKQISDAKKDINNASKMRAGSKYYALMNEADFDKYADIGMGIDNPTKSEADGGFLGRNKKPVGNIVTYSRENWEKIFADEQGKKVNNNGDFIQSALNNKEIVGSSLYHYMTDDEVRIHASLLGRGDETAAAEFLEYLTPTLNARAGKASGEAINAMPGVLKAPVIAAQSLHTGLDQFGSGISQMILRDEIEPTSQRQVESQVIQEDLGTVGKMLYGAGVTVGNMLPSILISTMTGSPLAGTVALGMSSAGNATNQAMQEGYAPDQARTYGLLVGASEAVLQHLIGGIGKLGGITSEKLLLKAAGIEDAALRLISSGVIKLGSEVIEEELQLLLEPKFEQLILHKDYEAPTWQEAVETAIVTALSTGLLEGGEIVGTEINYAALGEMVMSSEKTNVNAVLGEALTCFKDGSAVKKLAQKIETQKESGKALDASDVGRLYTMVYGEIGADTTVRDTTTKANRTTDTTTPKKKAPFATKAETDRLLKQTKSEDAETAAYATAQLAHDSETVVSPIAQALMDSGMKPATAVEQAALIMKVQNGEKLSNSEEKKLNFANESVRAAFTETTGIGVTSEHAQNGAPKRKVIRSAAEVRAAMEKSAEAQKAQETARATAQAEAEVVQQVEQQQAQAVHRARAENMMSALLEEAIAREEQTIEYADGSTQTQSEFVEAYRAQFPSVSEEEAVNTFNDYKRLNNMGQKVPEPSRPVKSVEDTNVPSKRSSVSESESDDVQLKRTEAGRAKERELTLKELNRIGGKYGVTVEMQDPDGTSLHEKEDGYYDSKAKKLVLNSKKCTNQFLMTKYFVHELTHHGQSADGNVSTGLTAEIIKSMRSPAMEKMLKQYFGTVDVDKIIADTRARYEAHFKKTGKDLSVLNEPNYIEDEVAADFMMRAIGNRSLLDTLAGVTVKPHQALIRNVKAFLSGKKDADVGVKEAKRLIERMQTSLETAQKQGLKNLEDSSTIDPNKREVKRSVEDSTDYQRRQDSGRTGIERHRAGHSELDAGRRHSGRGDLGGTSKLLIPEQTRRIMNNKGIPDVGLTETDDRSAFSVALDAAKAANPNGGMVDSQTVEGLTESGARTFMRPDGNAGVAVEADGNIVGVFKNPALADRGAVTDLVLTAIAQGGNHLDCYATYGRNDLRHKYMALGFEPVAWLEFNREYAPDDWNYEAWGEPDVVMWVHNGDTAEQIINRKEPYRVWTKDDIHGLPKFEDYDEAKAHQKAELEKRKANIAYTETAAKNKNTVTESGEKKYSIDPEFASDVDEWAASGKPDDWTLTLGSTGGVLQGLGAVENDIYILSDKMNQIMSGHPEMGLEEIKKLPQVLEDPVLILNSKNKVSGNARILVFGQYKAANGRPLLGVLDLRPVENGIAITDMQKLTSAYTKTGTEDDVKYFFNASDVLYADEKRAAALLKSVGFSMPTELQRSGFLGSIAYNKRSVNIEGIPFGEILPKQTVNPQKRLSISAEESEQQILQLRDEANSITEQLDAPFSDLSAAERKQLNNRLTKVNHELDKLVSEERRAAVKTPYQTVLDNLDRYRRADLESLAEQISDSSWDYEDLTDKELRDGLRETLEERIADMSPLEAQSSKFGLFVRAPEENNIRYSIDPVTGYEEGSVEDKVLKLLRAGTTEDAISMLEQWVADIEAGNIDPDTVESSLRDAYFKAQPLTPQQRADNRKKLDDLVKKYGAIKPGAIQRDKNGKVVSHQVIMPNRVRDTKGVSDFARTLAEAKQTPEWFRDEIERAIADEMSGYTYDIATDKAAMQYVKGRKQVSFEHNLRLWENVVELGNTRLGTGGITKNDIALGEYLYTEAVKAGDVDLATKLAAELATVGTAAGQVVQAMSLLKKMTPSGKLYYLSRTIERLNNQYQKKIDAGKMSKIKYDKDLAAAVLNAKTAEEAQKAMNALLQDVANQIPPTLAERWNAWRYLSMLGNPKTHIRNILSNVVFAPVTWLKDVVDATLFQPFVKRENRTKHLGEALSSAIYGLTFTGVKLDKYVRFADADYKKMKDVLSGDGKYNPADLIREMRPVFKAKAMDAVAKGNSKALDAEDKLFLREHYVRALSQYLAAQKADVASLSSTPEGRNQLAKARAWAVQEAKKATFRDASALANALSRLERSGVAGQIIVGGVMPFKKTPINILKRGAEYSPLGIVNTVKEMTKGKENAAKTLDSLAATLTGSGLIALGVYLAKEGLLRASGSDDEKEREFEELQGAQTYSLTLDDGTSYTIDWMAPAALPLFVGAKAFEVFAESGELTYSDYADVLMLIAEPMFQLSMLDGLNNTLTAAGYSDNPDSAVAASMLTGYFGQAIPTLLGQVARTVDDTRRSTYIDKNKDTIDTLDRTVQYNMTKVPGVSKMLAPKLDAWGRTDTENTTWLRAVENFISPGYVSTMKTSAMEEELERLYGTTGDNGVLPKSVSKYFTVDKVRRDLTADEWITYQAEAGQGAYEMLTRLVNSASYKSLSDAQRAKAVKDVFTYADEKAKEAAVSDYATDESWIAKADKLAGSGLSVEDYIVQSVLGAEVKGEYTKDVLGMEWLDDDDKALLISAAYSKGVESDNTIDDPFSGVAGKRYTLTEDQIKQYEAHFEEQWKIEYNKLISGRKYTMATLEDRANMVDVLKEDVAADTKKWMARNLKREGVRSAVKD